MMTIQVTLDDQLHRAAKTKATTQSMTLGNLVREAVAEKVTTTKSKNGDAR